MCLDDVYIVFDKSDDYWWTKLLHPIINHCYLIKQYNGRWIVYGKSWGVMDLYTTDSYSDILANSYIIKVKPTESNRGLFMLNTCVGQVKQYLGITNPFIWTPYQLFKRLNYDKAP